MTGFEIGIFSIFAILILIYSGLYVPVALGLVSFVSVWLLRGSLEAPIYLVTLAASNSLEDYIFGVIPLFVLMGLLVSQCELGRDIYEVANHLLKKLKGGLGVATVAANAAFAAITGVSIASAAVFTRVSVPEMIRFGYKPRFAVGVVAGSSVLGMLIPPSVMLIIYALITEQSVADLFTAGIMPGILLSLCYAVAIISMATFFPEYVGGQDEASKLAQEKYSNLTTSDLINKTTPILVLILLVLGGIYGGFFTPTEAGAVGAIGALLVAIIKRKLNRKAFWSVLVETGHIAASILMLIVAATMYSRMLALSGLPSDLGEWISQADIGLYGILTIYVLILILMGTILDTTSIILIMVPLFLPVMEPYGISLVWFGIITIVGAEIGLLTPPLGIACYVIKTTLSDDDRITLFDIFAGAFPFAIIMLLVLILLIVFPSISLFLV
ncbi:MAG: C4-dicarboxylate ABC transporter permease [Gammaproteobacteria bacterium TMED78]|nr:MAG: C4-dicarboxylate ABC transporter permease [Gammaproteobacteria bacterium TMED78]|tara:strand:- start:6679 stop:8004 length:1326 start_codon:yes stop_codon:yes gene_type:complete